MITRLFRNAGIVTPLDEKRPLGGSEQGKVETWAPGALLCLNGLIAAVGPEEEVLAIAHAANVDEVVDCGGRCVIPGLVDSHTHMCFCGDREEEFSQRLAGVSYLEILHMGGGILSTVKAVRSATEESLFSSTREHALAALAQGATTVEMKSGYGLDTESELKMLRVIRRVSRETPLDVVPTFLGAHAVPEEYRSHTDQYVDLVVEEMLPAVASEHLADYCDVFCEEGVFSIEQSRRILHAARQAGMGVKLHADEVRSLGGAGLAADLGATSAEHLLAAREEDLAAMARAGVIAVLLPGTALSLRKPYAPARRMIDMGLAIALASDFNPGSCFISSLPLGFALAVLHMDLRVEEALTACTLNAAHAVGMADRVGSLEVGKQADLLVLNGKTPATMAYRAGIGCIHTVYKKGERVAQDRSDQ